MGGNSRLIILREGSPTSWLGAIKARQEKTLCFSHVPRTPILDVRRCPNFGTPGTLSRGVPGGRLRAVPTLGHLGRSREVFQGQAACLGNSGRRFVCLPFAPEMVFLQSPILVQMLDRSVRQFNLLPGTPPALARSSMLLAANPASRNSTAGEVRQGRLDLLPGADYLARHAEIPI